MIENNKKEQAVLKFDSLPSHWKLSITKNQLYLDTGEGRPFTVDFSKLKSLSRNQPFARAIGVKKGQKIRVLDLTAGWGKDAYLLACLGCHVVALESHPLVFRFLELAARKNLKTSETLQFRLANSFDYLKTIKEKDKPEVIYMDPMFGTHKKSLSTKPLRILKELVGETQMIHSLFKQALGKARNRIVVKRHKSEKPMSGASLICTFSGRALCYDVFSPQFTQED